MLLAVGSFGKSRRRNRREDEVREWTRRPDLRGPFSDARKIGVPRLAATVTPTAASESKSGSKSPALCGWRARCARGTRRALNIGWTAGKSARERIATLRTSEERK